MRDETTLRTELEKIFTAAQEVIDALERHDYEGAEHVARYIKLKAMALAPHESDTQAHI